MKSHRNSALFFLVVVTLGSLLSQPLMVTAQQQAQSSGATGSPPISEGREYEYSVDPRRGDANEQQIIIMMPAVPASRARGLHGSTALMDAASTGELKAVEALLAKGADVNAQDKFGGTALVYAAREGYTEVVRILIAHGADVNARDTSGTGLHKAAKNGHLDVVRLLLTHGTEVDAKDYDGQTALIGAVLRGRTDVALELLRQGADPNAKRRGARHVSALETAVMNRDSLAVTALLAKGADLDQYGASALVLSAKAGLTDIVQILLDGGVSVDGTDAWGQTALHRASAAGRTDIVNVMLASGADVDAVDRSGSTSLMMAVAKGQSAVVSTLLAHGADVNVKDNSGKTALSIAAGAGQGRMVEFLLAHGADVNTKDSQGNTPLVYADVGGHSAIVRRLLPTDEPKDRSSVLLVFAREKDGKCEIGLWNPNTAQAKQLLSLPTCPKDVFVADGKTSIFVPRKGALQEVQFSPKVRVKTPIPLPKIDPEKLPAHMKKGAKWQSPVAAGYLEGETLGVTIHVPTLGEPHAFLYAWQDGTWVLLDNKYCGRFDSCGFKALNGRRSNNVWNWQQERRVWHPSHASNRYVVNRQMARNADGSPNSGTLTFDIDGQTSILTFFVEPGPDTGATLTFGITLQAGSRPLKELLGQCETSLVGKYLLFDKFWGGLRLIDLETGDSVLGELKLATWIN
ncbi:MAG: ankyrin repeat domain-containing protein [Gammaproteobacteria bacterium]|nr:ankyrin repeat domain-containing protein [Gammaproteobacteria bacterium]